MSLQDQINTDLKTAMKAKDADKLNTLRLLKSAISYAVIEKYGQDGVPTDDDVQAAIRKEVKKRNDSIESFEKAGREDVAAKERNEKEILEAYLPAALTEDEVKGIVQAAIVETGATSKKEMGQVMKAAMAKAQGRADGKLLSSLVQQALN